MNSKLEEYFSKAKAVQKENRDKHLIELGLYEKFYSPDGSYSPEYHLVDYTDGENRMKHYKTVLIEVTDEEYEQILEAERNKISRNQRSSNGIAIALTVIAILTYTVGFILGIVLGNQLGFSYTVIWWTASVVSGTMILGFAEIIKLLDKINSKQSN